MELVEVEYEFEYKARDGRRVAIKPRERYILVCKTSDHWWHVQEDQTSKPFYIPAQYVKECSLCGGDAGPEDVGLPDWPSTANDTQDGRPGEGHAGEALTPIPEVRPPGQPSVLSGGLVEEVMTTTVDPESHTRGEDGGGGGGRGGGEKEGERGDGEGVGGEGDQHGGGGEGTSSCSERNQTIITGDGSFSESQTIFPEHPGSGNLLVVGSTPVHDSQSSKPHTESTSNQRPLPVGLINTASGDVSEPNVARGSDLHVTLPEVKSPTPDLPVDKISTPVDCNSVSMLGRSRVNKDINNTDIDPNNPQDHESQRSAVYVNVAQLRSSLPNSPLTPACLATLRPPPLPHPEGWEVHTDEDTGQDYYYHPASGHSTWDNPLLSFPMDAETLPPPPQPYSLEQLSPPPSPASTSASASPVSPAADWEKLVDQSSGRPYFYNAMSGETSWDQPLSPYPSPVDPPAGHRPLGDMPPPFPEEDYPPEDYADDTLTDILEDPEDSPPKVDLSHLNRAILPRAALDRSAPAGWILNVDNDGTWVFTSEHSQEQWIKSLDDHGQTYYYLRDGSRSQWNLPEAAVSIGKVGNCVEADSVFNNWRHTMSPTQLGFTQEEEKFFPAHRRNMSDYGSDTSSMGHSPETQPHVQNLEKAGILNKTKVTENGKKVRKNWCQSWTVLHGGVLTFHKEPKSNTSGASSKTNQIVLDAAVDLRGAMIGWASREKSSKKNVLELKGKNGVEFLVQYDNEGIINDWYKVLQDTIRQLEYHEHPDHNLEEEDGEQCEKSSLADINREDRGGSLEKMRRGNRYGSSSTVSEEMDHKKVRNKLIKFLMKRPTLQSVKEKGYIRDNVFGCHLTTLCAQERTTVPSFVDKCILSVEKRGLDIDGLYRVSGNLAVIQKLRYKADHEELDLEDGQWEDVHVITGALKLFFRELPEPLFPYSHFNGFLAAIRLNDPFTKASHMKDLVSSLPAPNRDTMQLLFGHLQRVIEHGQDNRMTTQNVAIVFGPTLLRPEMESGNLAMNMVAQNQIVDYILREYNNLFG